MGMVTTRNPRPSIRQPPTRYIEKTTIRIKIFGRLSKIAHSASSKGSRVMVRKRPNMTAPVIMRTTIAEIRVVSVKARMNFSFENFLLLNPMISAPKDPAAPASVGVNHPAYIPPITSRKSNTASIMPVSANSFSRIGVLGPGGPSLGFLMHSTTAVISSRPVSIMPGMIQARKSWVMDCLVCTAMMMRRTLGGMTTPSVPPMATLPVLNDGS